MEYYEFDEKIISYRSKIFTGLDTVTETDKKIYEINKDLAMKIMDILGNVDDNVDNELYFQINSGFRGVHITNHDNKNERYRLSLKKK